MNKFPNIPNKDIVHFGYREEPYFTAAVIAGGFSSRKNLKEHFGLTTPINAMFVNFEMFNLKSSVESFSRELKIKLQGSGKQYVDGIIKGCYKAGNRLIKISKGIHHQVDKKKLSASQLKRLLKKYYREAYNYCVYYTIAWFEKPERKLAESLAKKYSNDEKSYGELLQLMTTPSQDTAAERERENFFRLCLLANNDPKKADLPAKNHAKKFGWLAVRYFIGTPWTKADILRRVSDAKISQVKKLLALRLRRKKQVELQLQKWLQIFSAKDKQLVSQMRNIIFLRTKRADFYHESTFYVQPLVRQIARAINVDYEDLLNFSPGEILAALQGTFNIKKHIRPRRKLMVSYFDSISFVLEGAAAERYIKAKPNLRPAIKPAKMLWGVSAYPGLTKGKVKIIMANTDLPKVSKGDILITNMTTPNFIAAMERAAAFVTNEGGILCHAAIVAREMQKPCITGTKIATKVFKDGDLVKVDAKKGIIIKI